MANWCTSAATVELKNPYLIPHVSATTLPNSPCVELAESTTLNSGKLTWVEAGTTPGTVFHASVIDPRLSLSLDEEPRENPDEEGGGANENGSLTLCDRSETGCVNRCRASR